MVRPSTPPRASPVGALARNLSSHHQRMEVVNQTAKSQQYQSSICNIKYVAALPNSASSTTLYQDCSTSYTYSPTRTMSPRSFPTPPCGCGCNQSCCGSTTQLALPTRRRQTPHASPSSSSTTGRGGGQQSRSNPALCGALVLCTEDEEPPRPHAPIPFAADGTPLACDGKLPKNKRRVMLRAAAAVQDGKKFAEEAERANAEKMTEKMSAKNNVVQSFVHRAAADGSLMLNAESCCDNLCEESATLAEDEATQHSAADTCMAHARNAKPYFSPPAACNLFDDEASILPSVTGHSSRILGRGQKVREESSRRPTPHEPVALPRLSGSSVGSFDGLLIEQVFARSQNQDFDHFHQLSSSPSSLRYPASSGGKCGNSFANTSSGSISRARGRFAVPHVGPVGMGLDQSFQSSGANLSSNYSSPDCSPPHPSSSSSSQDSVRRRQAADWDIARIVERYHIRTHCLDLHRQVEELQSENSALKAVLKTMVVPQGASE